MTQVILDSTTVQRLIEGAGHLYYPAFPDDDHRQEIGQAVNEAEEQLEALEDV